MRNVSTFPFNAAGWAAALERSSVSEKINTSVFMYFFSCFVSFDGEVNLCSEFDEGDNTIFARS